MDNIKLPKQTTETANQFKPDPLAHDFSKQAELQIAMMEPADRLAAITTIHATAESLRTIDGWGDI